MCFASLQGSSSNEWKHETESPFKGAEWWFSWILKWFTETCMLIPQVYYYLGACLCLSIGLFGSIFLNTYAPLLLYNNFHTSQHNHATVRNICGPGRKMITERRSILDFRPWCSQLSILCLSYLTLHVFTYLYLGIKRKLILHCQMLCSHFVPVEKPELDGVKDFFPHVTWN